jgi:phosphate-selective porin OprO and OprP
MDLDGAFHAAVGLKKTQVLAFFACAGRQNQERRPVVNRRGYALAVLAAMVITAGSSAAFGQEAPGASMQDKVNRMESLLKAQQEQIANLQQQVATQQAGGVEQMRVEEIKRVVQELFRDPAFRDQLPLNAGYDGGFFIKSGTDFMLKINGLMQARYVFDCVSNDKNRDHTSKLYGDDVSNSRSGLELSRIRLAFSGYAWDPNFTYRIELKADQTDAVNVYYAWMNYKFLDAAQVKIGLYKLPFGRQETTSDQKLMFVERSMANEVFNTGRSMGVMLFGSVLDKKVDYYASISNGFKDNLDQVDNADSTTQANNSLDTNPAVTARVVWHALYDQIGKDFESESDLEYHKKPAMDFGTSFAWNKDNGDARDVPLVFGIPSKDQTGPGGYSVLSSDAGNTIAQWGADAAFKYLGFALQAEYFLRMTDTFQGSAWALGSGHGDSSHQQGGYVQAGYFLVPQKLELAARMGGIWDFNGNNTWEYEAGVNYYIRGHNLKLQADVSRIYELPLGGGSAPSSRMNWTNQNDDLTLFQVQLQASF